MPEARLEDSGSGLAPAEDGWFVVNARDAEWWTSQTFGSGCGFESRDHFFPDFGINPKQAYSKFERPERKRPPYWNDLPWA